MSKKLISICIPTYNGAKTISKTLDSIIKNIDQFEDIREKLELVITDDCSLDETGFVVEEYVGKFDYIKFFKNTKNLGMDENFKRAALNASGEYIWFSGQDDIFLDGSVRHILDVIKDNEGIGLININFSQYSEDKNAYNFKSMFENQSINPSKIVYGKDLLFNNSEEYFEFFNDVPSFLPATVMKREFWVTTENSEYIGTHFIQYATILLNMRSVKIAAVTSPLIHGLVPSSGWQTNGNKLFTIQLGEVKAQTLVYNDTRNPFPRKIYIEKKQFYFKHFLRVAIASRYYKFHLSKENINDLKFIYGNKLYYLYFFPILELVRLTPYLFIKLLFVIKKSFIG